MGKRRPKMDERRPNLDERCPGGDCQSRIFDMPSCRRINLPRPHPSRATKASCLKISVFADASSFAVANIIKTENSCNRICNSPQLLYNVYRPSKFGCPAIAEQYRGAIPLQLSANIAPKCKRIALCIFGHAWSTMHLHGI